MKHGRRGLLLLVLPLVGSPSKLCALGRKATLYVNIHTRSRVASGCMLSVGRYWNGFKKWQSARRIEVELEERF